MKRTTISSSNIESVGYDQDTKTMEVAFKNGGVYHYHNVDPEHYDNLLHVDSPGSYFHTNIKGNHKYTQKK